jgi:hypothetical protein
VPKRIPGNFLRGLQFITLDMNSMKYFILLLLTGLTCYMLQPALADRNDSLAPLSFNKKASSKDLPFTDPVSRLALELIEHADDRREAHAARLHFKRSTGAAIGDYFNEPGLITDSIYYQGMYYLLLIDLEGKYHDIISQLPDLFPNSVLIPIEEPITVASAIHLLELNTHNLNKTDYFSMKQRGLFEAMKRENPSGGMIRVISVFIGMINSWQEPQWQINLETKVNSAV